jgi:hypothetical protein
VGGFVLVYKDNEPPTAYVSNVADARLIAAAPDLLAALKRIADVSGDPVIENICNAAIEKAEGK